MHPSPLSIWADAGMQSAWGPGTQAWLPWALALEGCRRGGWRGAGERAARGWGCSRSHLCPQVSHHPPVSAFHVSNRKDGFCISGSVTAKSRFYGEACPGLCGTGTPRAGQSSP